MALFSRRGTRGDSAAPVPVAPVPAVADEVADEARDAEASDAPVAPITPEAVPQVGISVSTFGKGPESARPVTDEAARPAEAAPAATPSVPGLPDNALVQQALRALPEDPQPAHIMNVMRQVLQGQLYVRAQGDAKELLEAGRGLNLAITTHEDKRFLLVFSGGAPVQASAQAENAGPTSALGQAAYNVLRTAIDSGYDGIYLDHANPGARLVLPIELITKAIEEGAPAPFDVKSLLAGPRTDGTAAEVADALTRVPVWAAGRKAEDGRIGLAEARGTDGVRRLEVYSHPLEVIAMGRGDGPLRLEPEQLARAVASEPALTGVVVDPAGPWIELDRDHLASLLALAG
ncbi:MAG: SseB family protein [Microbacterium sp.]|uniref:SseB family protein n=1 Tax=Microbacterium sp. TaxID=51671 RepID=UPI001AC789B4|nr:SseB family protein [Microbacterium sp.]MBN9178583.1 SseB family protein [Microbacterium sp.]